MYVSCPPLPYGGFQQGYDATKLGKIIQTAKFFFGKVLEGVQNYLRVLLSPPHIKLPKVSGFKDESVKISKKTCQNSISRSPKQGVHDTILTRKNRREIRSVLLPTILRRFFVVFVNVTYITDIQVHTTTQLSVRNKNGRKTWLATLQNSLSCSLTLTILACKEVKVRGQNSQSQSLTLTILQRKTV